MTSRPDHATRLVEWTQIPDKRGLFLEDVDFRTGADRAARHLSDAELEARLHTLALVVFKPDALAAHLDGAITREIENLGYQRTLSVSLALSASQVRALWRYQFRYATTTRVLLMQAYMSFGHVEVVAFERASSADGVPASTALSLAKGSSIPSRRDEASLRTKCPSDSRMLNWLHVSDEPADIVRELEILLPDASTFESFLSGSAPSSPRVTSEAVLGRDSIIHPDCLSRFDIELTGTAERDIDALIVETLGRVEVEEPGHLLCFVAWASGKVPFNDERLRHLTPIGRPSPADWRERTHGA